MNIVLKRKGNWMGHYSLSMTNKNVIKRILTTDLESTVDGKKGTVKKRLKKLNDIKSRGYKKTKEQTCYKQNGGVQDLPIYGKFFFIRYLAGIRHPTITVCIYTEYLCLPRTEVGAFN